MLEEESIAGPAQIAPVEPGAELLSPWYLPESRYRELPGVLCATDLLAAWQPEAAVAAPISSQAPQQIWDTFFSDSGQASAAPAIELQEAEASEHWDPAAATSAVDCLFRFTRALERSDLDAAMACISPEYHLFENDRDLDIHALRMRLERSLDEWRGPELRITLTEIPDPVFHPRGILIHATFQVDYRHKEKDSLETLLLGYLIHFDAQPGEEWLIHALCRVG